MFLVNVNGTRLAVKVDHAFPEAPWVVFGNSLVTDLSIWDAQVAALNGRFNILRYDQRGHGGSDLSPVAVDLDLLGSDLAALIDHQGISNAVYVGLSMGVPTSLAAYSPGFFRGLVLIDGQAASALKAAESWQDRIDGALASGMPAFATATANRWLAGRDKWDRLTAMIEATPVEGFTTAAAALKGYDYSAVLPYIDCPVLLMAGAQDGKMPETMQRMAQLIPASRFQLIDDAGHVPGFERPDAVNRHLLAFLETLP